MGIIYNVGIWMGFIRNILSVWYFIMKECYPSESPIRWVKNKIRITSEQLKHEASITGESYTQCLERLKYSLPEDTLQILIPAGLGRDSRWIDIPIVTRHIDFKDIHETSSNAKAVE